MWRFSLICILFFINPFVFCTLNLFINFFYQYVKASGQELSKMDKTSWGQFRRSWSTTFRQHEEKFKIAKYSNDWCAANGDTTLTQNMKIVFNKDKNLGKAMLWAIQPTWLVTYWFVKEDRQKYSEIISVKQCSYSRRLSGAGGISRINFSNVFVNNLNLELNDFRVN